MTQRPVTLPQAVLLAAASPFDHSPSVLAPPAIVAGDLLAWADRNGFEPCATGRNP